MNNSIREQFSEIQRHRKNLRDELENSKSKGIYEVLGDLYDDPTHFIYEIIQNADDENATYINIEILDDKVIIKHNGKPFNIEDVESICAIGNSEKKDKIGRFGIGFKSVFSITDRPIVHSNGFDFAIENFIVPVLIDSDDKYISENEETYIILPYTEKKNNISKLICSKINKTEYREFIFLNSIISIEINYNENSIFSYKKQIKETKVESFKRIKINNDINYLMFNDEENKFLKVAYKLGLDENDNEIIVPEYENDLDKTSLNAFFPIKYNTKLDFLLQGNFTISKDRKTINFDREENVELLDKLMELVAKSILNIIRMNQEYLIVYNILPVKALEDTEENYVYNKLIEKMHKLFNKESVWLSTQNEYCSKEKILTTDNLKIKKLFKASLFGTETYQWINDIFRKDERLKEFIEEYQLKKITVKDIKKSLKEDKEIINARSTKWLVKFYKFILSDKDMVEEFGRLPLIKTENEEFVPLLTSKHEYNVFSEIDKGMDIEAIKDYEVHLLNHEFLEPLKDVLNKTDVMPIFNGYNVIVNLLETNMKNKEDKLVITKYFEVLNKILSFYKTVKDNQTLKAIHNVLNKKLPIAGCINVQELMFNNDTNEYYINNSDPLNNTNFFLAHKEYIQLFENKSNTKGKYYLGNYSFNNNSTNERHYLVKSELYSKYLEVENFRVFKSILDKINIQRNILLTEETKNVIDYKFELKENQKSFNDRLRPQDNSNYSLVYNPSILYINNILYEITPENSRYLWKVIYEFFVEINFKTEGYFRYWYGASNMTPIKTKMEIIEKLKTSKWIYDKNNVLRSPESLRYIDLKDNGYHVGDNEKERMNYTKVCKILDISTDNTLSKQEKQVYKLIEHFGIEELDRLKEYVTNKLDNKLE